MNAEVVKLYIIYYTLTYKHVKSKYTKSLLYLLLV